MRKTKNHIDIVTTAELHESVGARESLALSQHQLSINLTLSQSWLKFHDDRDSFRHTATITGSETLEDRLRYLQSDVVKSALLGYWLHTDEFEEAKQFRDTRVVPLLAERFTPDWSVKMRRDFSNGSDMRFFIAKSALGVFHPDHGKDVSVVERRTFAAFATDGASPRPSDMNHVLGIAERHPNDERSVAIAPTSTSYYAFKNGTVSR